MKECNNCKATISVEGRCYWCNNPMPPEDRKDHGHTLHQLSPFAAYCLLAAFLGSVILIGVAIIKIIDNACN